MRVLTIAHNAVAASNRRRADALAALREMHVTLLTPRWWYEEGRRIAAPQLPTPTWRVGRTLFTGNGTRHLYLTGLFGAVRSRQPDVIDLFEEPFSVVALQTLIARELLAPHAALVVYSAVNIRRHWRQPYRAIEHLVLRRANGAHVPSSDVPPILRSKGMHSAPIEVVPLGVDLERFERALPMPLDGAGRPRVGFLGRLEPVKGLDVLLDAFDRHQSSATLMIAGDGSQQARVLARSNGRRVHVLPALAYEDVPGFLKSLDILVLPSVTIPPLHREQFGRVLVEAMAAGVPVIGSNSGAIPEVVADAGLVVAERDPLALAAAIDQLVRDQTLRQRLAERGRQRVRSRFAWPVVAEQTSALFRSAVVHRRRIRMGFQEVRV